MPAPEIGRVAGWSPSVQSRIDWGHPLAAGLVVFLVPALGSAARDLVSGQNASDVSGTHTVSASQYGNSGAMTSATSARALVTQSVSRTTPGSTIVMLAQRDSGNYTGDIRCGVWGTTDGTRHSLIAVAHSSGDVTGAAVQAPATYLVPVASAAVANGAWASIACRSTTTSTDVVINGVLAATTSGASAANATTQGFGIGDPNAAAYGGRWVHASFYNRPLSNGELAWLAADPSAFLVR